MKMLELFAGTGVMSKAFARAGFETYTIDWNPDFNLSLCADIGALSAGLALSKAKLTRVTQLTNFFLDF